MAELQLLREDRVVQVVSLSGIPLNIGRAANNGLVLSEPSVSNQHASVWEESGGVWIRDLGSSNGTWLGEQRVHGATRLQHGDRIRLGLHQWLQAVDHQAGPPQRHLMVEDLDASTLVPLIGDRFYIGSGPDAHLRLPEGPSRLGTLMVYPNEEVWLGTDEEVESHLPLGQTVEIGGRRLRVVSVSGTQVPTTAPPKKRAAISVLSFGHSFGGNGA